MSKILIDSTQVGQQRKVLHLDGLDCGKFSYDEYEKLKDKIWTVCEEYKMGMNLHNFEVGPQPFNQQYLEKEEWTKTGENIFKQRFFNTFVSFTVDDKIIITSDFHTPAESDEIKKLFEGPCKTVDQFKSIFKQLDLALL